MLRPRAPSSSSNDGVVGAEPMRRGRKRLIALGLSGFVLLSAFHAVTGREHWPFSPYEMYSTPKADYQSDKLLLVAVNEAGEERWMLSRGDLAPLNRARVGAVLARARGADRAAGLNTEATAAEGGRLREAFEQLVSVVAPNRPDARAFRLYHAVWEMHPQAANLNSPETWVRLAETAPAASGRSTAGAVSATASAATRTANSTANLTANLTPGPRAQP